MEENNDKEVSEARIKRTNNQPIIETSVTKSKDGKWIIHKTIITDIKPVSYFEKVLEGSGKE